MIYNESVYNDKWETKKLSDLGDFARGKSKHRPRNDPRLFEGGGYPLVQTGEIKDANLYIMSHTQEYGEFGLKQSKLWDKNTLCITIAANIAETALLSYPMCFPDSVVGFRAYEGISTERFMYYVFSFIRNSIQNSVIGSTQDNINIDFLTSLDFKIPTKKEQDKIADILSAIDLKILSNNQINDNLQHQLKLLYDYWFTQFDFPNENGKPYRASGGAMVWCDELQREIPKGWKVSTLSDIAVLQAKSVMPQEGTAYNHYSIPAFDDTHSPEVEDGKAIASNKYVVPDNSVLVSKLNPQFKRIWLIIDSTDNAICSTEFLPVKATETGVYALYSLLNSDAFSVHLIQNASSSTGSRKRIDPDNCMSYKFPYDQKVFARFDKAIQPLLMKITGIPTETQALVALRDWLLPMLMNGQATISD